MKYIFIPATGLGIQLVLLVIQIIWSIFRPFFKRLCAAPLIVQGWTPTGARMYCALESMKVSMRFIQANTITLTITFACLVLWLIVNLIADNLESHRM